MPIQGQGSRLFCLVRIKMGRFEKGGSRSQASTQCSSSSATSPSVPSRRVGGPPRRETSRRAGQRRSIGRRERMARWMGCNKGTTLLCRREGSLIGVNSSMGGLVRRQVDLLDSVYLGWIVVSTVRPNARRFRPCNDLNGVPCFGRAEVSKFTNCSRDEEDFAVIGASAEFASPAPTGPIASIVSRAMRIPRYKVMAMRLLNFDRRTGPGSVIMIQIEFTGIRSKREPSSSNFFASNAEALVSSSGYGDRSARIPSLMSVLRH